MTTHTFNHPTDLAEGGIWCGDYGMRICRWTWDSAAKELHVVRGPNGKRIDLRGVDLSTVDLRERLPQIALQAAGRIAEGK
jgi:hypothetical protein